MRIDRFSDRQNRMVCLSGVAGIAALLAAARWGWGLPVSAERSDVIILVLANMALFGSLVWLYTRNNLLARLGVLALLAALRLGRRFVERSVVELVACAVAFPLRLPEIPLYHHSRHDCGRPYL